MNTEQQTPLEASRPLGVAQDLTATVLDAQTAYARKVVLTGELLTLSTPNGRSCLLIAMRLLSRVVGPLWVALPDGLPDLKSEVSALADAIWSQGDVHVCACSEDCFVDAIAVLNVGNRVREDLPWTCINSNGWVARCTSTSTRIPEDCDQANPLGAMMAASAGVSEVFKRVYGVPAEFYPLMDCEQLSLFTLDPDRVDVGPPLSETVRLPSTLMLGAGAIGNALALLMSELPLQGKVHVVDKQAFGPENFGTCCLLDEDSWLGVSKARNLAGWLNDQAGDKLEVTGEQAYIADVIDAGTLRPRQIDLVINGLDDNQARHDVQRLWPSLLVDGAINSFGAAVVTHRLDLPSWACMQCTFELPNKDAVEKQAKATGLDADSLKGDTNRQISDADIDAAAPEIRDALRAGRQAGATLCSMLPGLLALQRMGVEFDEGFRPSVPFVASAAAALAMAQVLRRLRWPETRFVHEFQIADLFKGFHTSLSLYRRAAISCLCTQRRSLIMELANRRQA